MIDGHDLTAELREFRSQAGDPGMLWLAQKMGRRVGLLEQWEQAKPIGRSSWRSLKSALQKGRDNFGLEVHAPRTNGAASHTNGHGDLPFDAGEDARAAKAAAATRKPWETTADVLKSPPRDYLVDGLLARGEMSLWVGPPKVGKTFLLLNIAYLLAVKASKILGRAAQPATVLYVTAEGGPGLRDRLRALQKVHGRTDNLLIYRRSFDLRREGGDVAQIIAKAKEVGAAFVVIDTVNRALAGGEENSSKDMGDLVRNCDLIKEETGAHVALIHHTPQDRTSSRSRGHSSLPAACDLVMSVWQDRKTGIRRAMVVEARDIREGAVFPYRLIEVECEADESGEAITASIVESLPEEEESGQGDTAQGRPTRAHSERGAPPTRATDASRAMPLLRARIVGSGKSVPNGVGAPPGAIGIPEAEFRAAYTGSRSDATPNAARQAYNRAIAALAANHGVHRGGDWLWIDPSVTA